MPIFNLKYFLIYGRPHFPAPASHHGRYCSHKQVLTRESILLAQTLTARFEGTLCSALPLLQRHLQDSFTTVNHDKSLLKNLNTTIQLVYQGWYRPEWLISRLSARLLKCTDSSIIGNHFVLSGLQYRYLPGLNFIISKIPKSNKI